MPALASLIRSQAEADKPACALYSIGAVLPLEHLYAWVLNEIDIGLFCFQHGYSNVYFTSPLTAYFEFNPDIRHTTFCLSRVEAGLRRAEEPALDVEVTGCIRHSTWRERQRSFSSAGNGRALLIQGRYSIPVHVHIGEPALA